MVKSRTMSKTVKIFVSLIVINWLAIIFYYVYEQSAPFYLSGDTSSRPLQFLSELWRDYPSQNWSTYNAFPVALLFSFMFLPVFVSSTCWPFLFWFDRLNQKGIFKLSTCERWVFAFAFGTISLGYLTLFLGWPLKALNKPLFLGIYIFFFAGGIFYFVKK